MAENDEHKSDQCSDNQKSQKLTSSQKGDMLSNSLSQSLTGILTQSQHGAMIDGLLHSIINSLPGPAHIKSSNHFEYKIANNNTLNLLGMNDNNELIGKNDYDVASFMAWRWPSGFADDLQKIDHDVLYNNNPIIGKEHDAYINGEGTLVALTLTKIPLYDNEQNPLGILTFAINTADLKSSERLRDLYYQFYTDKKIAHEMFLNHIGLSELTKKHNINETISEKELDILIMLSKGRAPKEIAYSLGLSNRTIETYIDNLKYKLNCYNRSDLLELFLKYWLR